MALIKKAVDQANKRVQFAITESCSGISFDFTGGVNTPNAVITVILVEENEPNKILYKFQKGLLYSVLGFAFNEVAQYIPFAIDKDLKLSKAKYILVEFSFEADSEAPTEIQYETVISPDFTDTPVEIKTIPADGGEVEFSSENYSVLRVFSDDTLVVNAQMSIYDGVKTMPKSVRYPSAYLMSLTDKYTYNSLIFPPDTKVRAVANSAMYLVKF